jgi:exodeoxyribonuclease VII small subunit
MAGKGKQGESLNFEKSLKRLETIVTRLEDEEVSLETSLKLFGEAQELVKSCQSQLGEAELKIRTLMEAQDGDIRESELE